MADTPEIQRESRDLLDEVAVEYLRRDGIEVEIPSGETVLRRGDTVGDFWVILEGEVEVRRRSEHDGHLTLARRGPGGTFGERINTFGWAVLILGCTVYTFVSLWLVA